LEEPNVGPVGGGGTRDGQVVDVGKDKGCWNVHVYKGDVYDQQEGGDGRACRHTNRYRSKSAGGPLEGKAAGAIVENGTNPFNKVGAHGLSAEEGKEAGSHLVVEPSFHVQEEGRDSVAKAVTGLDVVLKNKGSVCTAAPWEGPTLEGVDEGT